MDRKAWIRESGKRKERLCAVKIGEHRENARRSESERKTSRAVAAAGGQKGSWGTEALSPFPRDSARISLWAMPRGQSIGCFGDSGGKLMLARSRVSATFLRVLLMETPGNARIREFFRFP